MLGGLSIDQLRWIFSSYSELQLQSSGWDAEAVPFSDGDVATHLWSELNANCSMTEIKLAGPEPNGYTHNFFFQHVLQGQDESLRGNPYQSDNMGLLDAYVTEHTEAIYFTAVHDLLAAEHTQRRSVVTSVPIMNKDGKSFDSDGATFENNDYPLLRDIYLAVDATPASMQKTRPFLEYGLSQEGSELLIQSGFWPIPEWEKLDMYTRLQSKGGLSMEMLRSHCGPPGQKIAMAGSSTVFPIANIWSRLYRLACDVDLTVEGGGSGAGAGRLCANMEKGEPVDIGTMSRDWKDSEAMERAGEHMIHDCLKGDTDRSGIRIDVALDGIVIALPRNSVGYECVHTMGGLSLDQVRWIYSGHTEEELTKSGWQPSSLPNSDGDPGTHLWSELDRRCAAEEIDLMGDPRGDGTFAEFAKVVFQDWERGETVASNRPHDYTSGHGFEILSNALQNPNAIIFVSNHYFFEKTDLFWAVPLGNGVDGFVAPSSTTIADGTYPIRRPISMHLLNHEQSLQNTIPFLEFGLMHGETVSAIGYIPMQGTMLKEMQHRLHAAPYPTAEEYWNAVQGEDENDLFLSTGAIVGIAVGLCLMFGFIASRVLAVQRM